MGAKLRALVFANRGSEIAEAALVLPLAFTMLLGIYWFGRAFSIYGTITHAAREGARAAVAPVCALCPGTNAQGVSIPTQNAFEAIRLALLASKLDPTQVSQPVAPDLCVCGTNTCASPVPCDSVPTGEPNACVQENVQLFATVAGATPTCGTSVTFQYPYQFFLPFTQLNTQRVNLRAQAQMKGDN